MRSATSTSSPALASSSAMSAGARQWIGSGPATMRSCSRFHWYFHLGVTSRSFTMHTPPGLSARAMDTASGLCESGGKWWNASQASTPS